MRFDPGSRSRLTPRDLHIFGGTTLFDHIARVVCEADCLPRKELYEGWEVARRARRRFRGGRVVDLAAGHGLVAHLLLLLDATSESAIAVDTKVPQSAPLLAEAFTTAWPRLAGRVTYLQQRMKGIVVEPGDLVVSVHACGGLTDDVLAKAIEAKARVAVLPCCHSEAHGDAGGLGGWVDDALAQDVTRAARLRNAGYTVFTQTIPAEITPKNRLLLGSPQA